MWLLLQVLPLDRFGYHYPPMAMLLGLVGMVVVAIIASVWPSQNAARKTISEILRYQ